MNRRSYVCILFVGICLLMCREMYCDDFSIGCQAFEQENYSVAEVFFKAVIDSMVPKKEVAEASYYLIEIYRAQSKFIPYLNAVNRFLDKYAYDERCPELARDCIDALCERQAYLMAYHYATRYDFYIDREQVLPRLGLGLYSQGHRDLAAQVLSSCPEQDTILVLRSSLTDDIAEKRRLFEHMNNIRGSIYRIELLLDIGDTIGAYDVYNAIDTDISDPNLLYRYAKVGYLFNISDMYAALEELRQFPEYAKKIRYMEILVTGDRTGFLLPEDKEECRLFALCCGVRTLEHGLPDSIILVSIVSDSDGVKELEETRQMYPDWFTLDSMYCELLLQNGDIDKAHAAVSKYLDYVDTYHYVRFIRGVKQFHDKDYSGSFKEIVLSQNKQLRAEYVLARASANLARDPLPHYQTVIDAASDSMFLTQVQREILPIYYEQHKYDEISIMPPDIITEDDTTLYRMYLYSLARTGQVHRADSMAHDMFGHIDLVQADHYGRYLLDNKAYNTARYLYDSLHNTPSKPLSSDIQYTWALVPMLQGDIDTALHRFKQVLACLEPDRPYYLSAFKCASIYYLKEEFDSAAHYYGLASLDDSLKQDALRNQMVCYKKAAEWKGVMDAAEELLPLIDDQSAAEIYFEYGYAQLRYGDFRDAIRNFRQALQYGDDPEYYYWLAETHLAKGNFTPALYYYRKITYLFPEDEMWTPTAYYKVGITLEFMDEIEEAKKLYFQIIEQRGSGDTWSIEAQKRLDSIE